MNFCFFLSLTFRFEEFKDNSNWSISSSNEPDMATKVAIL